MPDAPASFADLDQLRQFVQATLCGRENLLPEQSRFVESVLTRGGEECGRQYFVHGPRLVQLSAIWAADQGWLYCYDTRGERFLKLRVTGPLAAADALRTAS